MKYPLRLERALPPPIATCRGRAGLYARLGMATWLLPTVVGVGAWLALFRAPHGVVPPVAEAIVRSPAGVVVVTGLCLVGQWLLQRHARARAGEADVHRDRVVIACGLPRTVFFRDVTSFDDASGDVVHLHLGDGPGRTASVPTGGADRTPFLAALDAAGVPRLDARTVEALPPPRLVVQGPRGVVEHVAIPVVIVLCMASAAVAPTVLLFAPPVVALLWLASSEPGFGTARLREDRIELEVFRAMSPRPGALAWDDVVGWQHGASHHILLLVRPGALRDAFPSGVPVPTPDHESRHALLSTLAELGIHRVR